MSSNPIPMPVSDEMLAEGWALRPATAESKFKDNYTLG
jgi:hypothetical protein